MTTLLFTFYREYIQAFFGLVSTYPAQMSLSMGKHPHTSFDLKKAQLSILYAPMVLF